MHPEPREQDVVDKAFSAEGRECGREREDSDEINSGLGEYFELLVTDREQSRRSRGIHDFQWMWIEGDEQAMDAEAARSCDELPQDVLVPAMNPIEAAYRQGGPRNVWRKAGIAEMLSHR